HSVCQLVTRLHPIRGWHKDSICGWLSSYKEGVKKAAMTRRCSSGIRIRAESVSDTGVGKDEPRPTRMLFDFFPELANEDAEILGLIHVGLTPNFLKQHAVGEHFSRMFNHVLQEVIFGGCQFDRLPIQAYFPPVEVH